MSAPTTIHRQAGSAGRTVCGAHNHLPRDQVYATNDPRAVTCKGCISQFNAPQKKGKGIRRSPRRRK